MRGNEKRQMTLGQRRTLEAARPEENASRKEKRRAERKAQATATAAHRSSEGRMAAETMREDGAEAGEKEHSRYGKAQAKASLRSGGKRKQSTSDLCTEIEE